MMYVSERKITLNEMIANKERSKTHLKQFIIPQFIKFCQPHQQIANNFGYSRICKKSSLMCNIDCQKHKREDHKHQFMNIKQFVRMMKNIKERYIEYHGILLNKAIPDFIGKLKIIILQFIQGLQDWDEETSTITNFAYYTKNKKIIDLLTADISDFDMSNFTCRDMCELHYVSEKIKIKTNDDFYKDIMEDLRDLFYRSLTFTSHRLLPLPRQKQKQQELIRGSLDETIRRIKQLQIILEKNIKQDIKIKSNLTIILSQNINIQNIEECQEKTNNALKAHMNTPLNQKPQLSPAQRQQQINQKIVQFIELLQQYMRKCHNPKIKFAFKISHQNTQFWQFFFEKLLNIIREQQRNSTLNLIEIYTQNPKQISKMFSQYVTNESQPLSINLRIQEVQKKSQNQKQNPAQQNPIGKQNDGQKAIKQYMNRQSFQNYIRASFKYFSVIFY